MNIFALCLVSLLLLVRYKLFLSPRPKASRHKPIHRTGKCLPYFFLLGMYVTAALGLRVVIGGNSGTD